MISDKRFEELKPIYLNAYELFTRLSVVAPAVALVRGTGSTDVPTKKRSMTIWEFETMDNGNKVSHLQRYGGTQHFAELMDTNCGMASAAITPRIMTWRLMKSCASRQRERL
jgi:hypothetical protein